KGTTLLLAGPGQRIETMSDSVSDLELLRRRIDEIDDRLQDLLIERAEIVASVGAHKRGTGALPAHQPWREAEIIRRLVRRGKGAFPAATLVRMWRELLARRCGCKAPLPWRSTHRRRRPAIGTSPATIT